MTNLEINQAVYQAMCKIADKWFKFSVEKCEKLREKMEEKPQITAKEFYAVAKGEYVSQWDIAKSDFDESTEFPEEIIEVGNFKCNVNADNLWPLMKAFQKLAKAKDHIFTYEKESRLDFIAEEEIRFVPGDCKRLVNFVCKDIMYTQLTYVHVEYNVKTRALAFFASDSHAVAVMATADSIVAEHDAGNSISAHFTVSDWKRLWDASQKTKQPARFYIFPDAIEIGCGDVRITSIKDQIAFPNCQRIMPDKSTMRHIALAGDEIKPFQAWLKKVKIGEHVAINVSVYAGNEMMYVDIFDFDHDTRTTKMFRLAETATETFGTAYNSDLLRTKPTGFWIAPNGFTYIEDAAFDKVLQMQYVRDVYTYDEQEREIHALAECGAKVVPLATIRFINKLNSLIMDKTKTIVMSILLLCLGYIIWSISVVTKAENEINYLREANNLKREIIITYGSYERACDEIFLHNSEAGWDSLNAAQEKLDSLFEGEL